VVNGKYKLMQVTHDIDFGGLQQVVVNLCKFIDKELFDVSVLCLRNMGAYLYELSRIGVRVHKLSDRPDTAVNYFSFLEVAKIFRREKIDIIHTHNTHPLIDGVMASCLSKVKTIVHTDHARQFPDKKRYMFAEMCSSLLVYKVVGVSDHTVNSLRKYEKIPSKKLCTILNGIDGCKYVFKIDKIKKRHELGIKNNGPIIGLCVRITEQKGIEYLLQAMIDIIRVYPQISLVIGGDGVLLYRLKEMAKRLGIDQNVFFIGFRLDIPDLLKLFDLYVLPSLWEGLPMVLLEAMAAGCPIVATNVGGNHQAVVNKYNGILVEPRNPRSLADAILFLLSQPETRKAYANNGQMLFKKFFSAEVMAKRYENLYLKRG
jgi:glycosyltransferase involved in cell wall biosynthesis